MHLLRQRCDGELLRPPQGRALPPRQIPQLRRTGNSTDKYIRGYNDERISTKLKGLSPVQYGLRPWQLTC
ncbi:IS3 family transposase [Arthrobacter globiformis]|uniref:IS3 family transposase n=1 Tax=Arthrobacter globiformis TaxID=1665 RepID=UPI00358FCF7D